jgi:predicted PurR-regulated permease PerM
MSSSHPEILLTTAATLLLALLGYTIAPVLSPFIAAGGLVYLLYPWRHRAVPRRVILLTAGLFTFWLLVSLGGVLLPFGIAFLLAYMLNPLVTRAEMRGIPRWLSALGSMLLLVAGVTVVVFLLLPPALDQFEEVLTGVRGLVDAVRGAVGADDKAAAFLGRLGMPMEQARGLLAEKIAPALEELLRSVFGSVLDVVTGFSSVVLQLVNLVIVPFLAFYILMDFPLIMQRAVDFWPQERRESVRAAGRKVDGVLGRYLRGALIVALIQGVIATVVLWFLGVRYPLVLGIMTGILSFIPYLGLITSLIVATIVTLFSGGAVAAKVAGVIVLYLSQELLESTVLGPKIIGSEVGIHPVLLIFCLLLFGAFFGLLGMLIAVPVTALLMLLLKEWEERRAARVPAPPEEPAA